MYIKKNLDIDTASIYGVGEQEETDADTDPTYVGTNVEGGDMADLLGSLGRTMITN